MDVNGRADDLGECFPAVTMCALFSRAPETPASPGAVGSDAAVAEGLTKVKPFASGAPPAPPASRPSASAGGESHIPLISPRLLHAASSKCMLPGSLAGEGRALEVSSQRAPLQLHTALHSTVPRFLRVG